MAYEGYLELGGEEIINASRTAAYVGAAMPTFGLKNCEDCDGLVEALGDVNVLGPEQRQGVIAIENHNLASRSMPSELDEGVYVRWSYTGSDSGMGIVPDGPSAYEGLLGQVQVIGVPDANGVLGHLTYEEDSLLGWSLDLDSAGATRMYFSMRGRMGSAAPMTAQMTVRMYDPDDNLLLTEEGPVVTMPSNLAWQVIDVEVLNPLAGQADRAVMDVELRGGANILTSGTFSNAMIQANTAPGGTRGWKQYVERGMESSLEIDYAGYGLSFETERTLVRRYDVARQVLEQREYRTPMLDGAPWFDPTDPDSANFWGLYPLSWDGVDDGTREVPVTELIGDGAVAGRTRAASREMRFEGMLLAKDERALASGFAWLNRALDATRCDTPSNACRGESMRFYSACPPACGWDACMDNPLSFDFSEGVTDPWQAWVASPDGGEVFNTNGIGGCNLPGLRMAGVQNGERYTFSRKVGGFVAGEWYTLRANISSTSTTTTVGVHEGPSITLPENAFWSTCDTTGMYTMSWRATSDVQSVYVATVDRDDANPHGATAAVLTSLDIKRVMQPTTAYSTTFPDNGSQFNGWDLRAAAGNISPNATHNPGGGVNVSFTAQVAASTMAVGSLFERTFRGLVPGETYSVHLSMATFDDPIDISVRIDGQPVDGGDIEWVNAPGGFGWSASPSVSFVASQTSHTVQVWLDTAIPFPAQWDVVSFTLNFASLEREQVEPLEHPNPGRRYERNMYRVTAISGPTRLEQYDKDCGVMMRVSFGLNAGVPFLYGPIQEVGSAFGGSSSLIPNLECVEGGQVRENMVPNPSVEVNLLGWSTTGGTLSRVAGGLAPGGGNWHASVSWGNNEPGLLAEVTVANNVPVAGGFPYTFSVYAMKGFMDAEPEEIPWAVDIVWNTGQITSAGFPRTGRGNRLTRLSVSGNAPADATSARLVFRYSPGYALAGFVRIDMALFEQGSSVLDYFDGSTEFALWTGTANNSPSILTPVEVDFLVDPDCPALPPPPAPPQIPEDCLEVVGAWQRYSINVLPAFVPENSAALPIVTVRTGDVAARSLRMRWYPNPDDAEAGAISECSYEAEIVVSYMPPSAEMVVNAIERDARAVQTGSRERSAMHLLYGPDNGPVVWPALRCGIPYVFTLDVASDEDTSELDVFLDLGVQV